MNSQVYQLIVRTINSNGNVGRDEIYCMLNNELKDNKDYLVQAQARQATTDEQLKRKNSSDCWISMLTECNVVKKEDHDSAPIRYQTFISIYSNLKRRQLFKTSVWRKLKENALEFSAKYQARVQQSQTLTAGKKYKSANERLKDNVILNMAHDHGLSPILMVRLILEGLIKTNSIELIDFVENNETGDSGLTESNNKKKEKITISQIIRETNMLKDGRLACEIIECCAVDDDYGPIIDSIKNLSGFKYERMLENILAEKKIAFIKESELREKGFDKTPDFKFEVPIALKNGIIISWVDSKCSFGDELTHAEYYETQFKFYLNRFGSGLVIYWLGFVKEIENTFTTMSDRSVIVSDHFPNEFTVFDLSALIDDNI